MLPPQTSEASGEASAHVESQSQVEVPAPASVTTPVAPPISMGRGMLSKLKSLGLSTTLSSSAKQSTPEQPLVQSELKQTEEDTYKPVLIHQEKPPLIKKGELGTRQDKLSNYDFI